MPTQTALVTPGQPLPGDPELARMTIEKTKKQKKVKQNKLTIKQQRVLGNLLQLRLVEGKVMFHNKTNKSGDLVKSSVRYIITDADAVRYKSLRKLIDRCIDARINILEFYRFQLK